MTSGTELLYVFQHVLKTGGVTFIRNLECNYHGREMLGLSNAPSKRLGWRKDVEDIIHALEPWRRDQLRVLYGHNVFYGVHQLLGRPARYVTFLRDPVARAVSNYNFFLENYDLWVLGEEATRFPRDPNELTFERWLGLAPDNLQVRAILGYTPNGRSAWVNQTLRLTDEHLALAKRILDDYYFVGLTETFEEDSLFLYAQLGLTRFLKAPQNVTRRRRVEIDDQIAEQVRATDRLDVALYEHATRLNHRFKQEHPEFHDVVEHTRANRRFVRPLRFLVDDTLRRTIGLRRRHALVTKVRRILRLLKNIR